MATAISYEPIRSGESYLLDEFRRRAGLGRHSFRMALRAGLKVIRLHGRVYVRGEDWLAYLAEQADQGSK